MTYCIKEHLCYYIVSSQPTERRPQVPAEPAKKRRRGAPYGNTNALLHGFYAKKLPLADLADLQSHSFFGLSEEIQILRVFIRSFVDSFIAVTDPYDKLSFMRAFSLAFTSLTRLMRTERILGDGSLDAAFSTALSDVCQELGLDSEKPSHPSGRKDLN